MADAAPTTPPASLSPPVPTGPGPAMHIMANPISPTTEVAAHLAEPKTQRSAEEVLADVRGLGGQKLGRRTVRCVLKPDHPLDHTTYGHVQFAKFTEIVSGGGAVRVPQQGAINHLSDLQVARIVADARDCIARFAPGGRNKNSDGTFTERKGRGSEYRVSQVGENYVLDGDRLVYYPPRVTVNGERKMIPLDLSDADAAKALGVTEIDINEARRESDVRSLIALEFDPKPMADIPDSLESAIEEARKAQHAIMALPKRGDPEANVYGRPVALDLQGRPTGGAVSAAASGTRHVGGDVSGVSDEHMSQAALDAKRTGIATLEPSPDMGAVKDAGLRVSGTGKVRGK